MDLQKFNHAKKIERKLYAVTAAKTDVIERIDNLLLKTTPYGSKTPEERESLRKLFAKLKPVLETHFEEEISSLETQFKAI